VIKEDQVPEPSVQGAAFARVVKTSPMGLHLSARAKVIIPD
jgi:hypothetical protein